MAVAPPVTHLVEYHLTNEDADVEVRLILNRLGNGLRLFYRRGDEEDFGFQSLEITTVTSEYGVQAAASLDTDGVPGPVYSFEVVVPVIVLGPDLSELGPFAIRGAGIRREHMPVDAGPGPKQAFEVFPLTGTAYGVPG